MSNNTLPDRKIITVAGKELDVSPLTVGEFKPFNEAMKPIAPMLMDIYRKYKDGRIQSLEWADMLDEYFDEYVILVSVMSRADKDWLRSITLDEFIAISEEVIATNANFLINRVLPKVVDAATRLKVAVDSMVVSNA